MVNIVFETCGIKLPGVFIGDKVPGPANNAVVCCLPSSLKELLNFSKS